MKSSVASILLVLAINAPAFGTILPLANQNVQEEVTNQQEVIVEDTRSDEERPEMGAIFRAGDNGVIVESVFTNGPFHQINIFSGDIINKVDGVEVKSGADIYRILLNKKPGDVLTLTRIRDGQSVEQSVKLMSRKKLHEVSNTREESTANISRQYVTGQAIISGNAAGLQQMESRVQMLEAEIQYLRRQIERMKNEGDR